MSRMSISNIRENWDNPERREAAQQELSRRIIQSYRVLLNLRTKHCHRYGWNVSAAGYIGSDYDTINALINMKMLQRKWNWETEQYDVTFDYERLYELFETSWDARGNFLMIERATDIREPRQYRLSREFCESNISELGLKYRIRVAQSRAESVEQEKAVTPQERNARRDALDRIRQYIEKKQSQLTRLRLARLHQNQ